MNDEKDESEQGQHEPSGSDDQVRLVTRTEADEALASGRAVGRRPQQPGNRGPANSGGPSQEPRLPLDLRSPDLRSASDDNPTVQMPHWSEPPTGEVPKIFGQNKDSNDSSSAFRPFSSNSPSDARSGDTSENPPSGKSDRPSWTEDPAQGPSLADLGAASGLGSSGVSEDPAPDAEAPIDTATAFEGPGVNEDPNLGRTRDGHLGEERPLDSVSLVKRLATGGTFAVAAGAAFLGGPVWILVLILAVLLFAAVEYFDALRRVGFRPATALGLVAIAGAVLGGYARGEAALPLVMGLSLIFAFVWYLTGVLREAPTANIAVTLLGVVWIGVMGAYATLLLRMPGGEGVAFLGGAILVTIAYDTAAYLGGSMFGRHKLAPSISPSKSWEGLAAGTAAAMLMGGALVSFISPWSVATGVALGLIVALVAPIGDFAESMVKRDLGLKDMGRILPGHGGVLDRFDALLFVLPATYYLVLLLNI